VDRLERAVSCGTYLPDAKVALISPVCPPDPTSSRIALEAIVGSDGVSAT